jgi:tRNA-binding EMAP/Myf-like protein
MKFTFSWLKDHLDTDAPLDAIADKLTMIGLEVEHIENRGRALAAFTIARVISAERHPNADRLSVCLVDTGSGDPVQVVCGAPNARSGMKGVFSPPGTYIPGKDITLGVGTIRGVESRGMLCSGFELQLSDDHEGILDLPGDAPVGVPYAEWAELDDPTIEINLTPNRPDCTGVHGIARDLAAADMGHFKDPPIKPVGGAFPCPVGVRFDFGATAPLCRGFALRLVRACVTARVRRGCSGALSQSGCGRSRRSLTSRTTSRSTTRGRCTCSTPPRSEATSWSGAPARVKRSPPSTARPMNSTSACASSPMSPASCRWPASSAAPRPVARRQRPTC